MVRQPCPAHCKSVTVMTVPSLVALGGGLLTAHPVPASGPQDAHGGGVSAGLGGEMAAIAEHVRPAAQRPEVLVRMGAEAQARGDQPPLVGARIGVDGRVVGCDTPRQDTHRFGALGGVLGQIGGDLAVGNLAVASEPDDARVDLGTPGDVPASGLRGVRNGGEPGRARYLLDDLGQHLGSERRVRRDGLARGGRDRGRRGGRRRGSGSGRAAGTRRLWRRRASPGCRGPLRACPGGGGWRSSCAATTRGRGRSTRRPLSSRSSPGTAGGPGRHRSSLCRCPHEMRRPCGQKLALRRGRHLATVPPGLTTRVWTGPKEGAVKVANTHGCAASDSGIPLPPASPARMSW